jgi:hypothetical protein
LLFFSATPCVCSLDVCCSSHILCLPSCVVVQSHPQCRRSVVVCLPVVLFFPRTRVSHLKALTGAYAATPCLPNTARHNTLCRALQLPCCCRTGDLHRIHTSPSCSRTLYYSTNTRGVQNRRAAHGSATSTLPPLRLVSNPVHTHRQTTSSRRPAAYTPRPHCCTHASQTHVYYQMGIPHTPLHRIHLHSLPCRSTLHLLLS